MSAVGDIPNDCSRSNVDAVRKETTEIPAGFGLQEPETKYVQGVAVGDLSISASSVPRDLQLVCADHGSSSLVSVVEALRCDSGSTRLECFGVRPGSAWKFAFHSWQRNFKPGDVGGRPDVMKQDMRFELGTEDEPYDIVFEHIWDDENLASRALLEAMRTNKTVQSLELIVDDLEGPHLTAIVDSLLENDTLESFSMRPRCMITCPIEDVSAAVKHIMRRNMCLRDIYIYDVKPGISLLEAASLPGSAHDSEGELLEYCMGLVFDEEGNPFWPVHLGKTVREAVDRNEQAWDVAKHLGQLNRSSMDGCQHLGDIGFRRQILVFFLHKDCQAPPRQMLHIAGGLPVWRHVCRDAR